MTDKQARRFERLLIQQVVQQHNLLTQITALIAGLVQPGQPGAAQMLKTQNQVAQRSKEQVLNLLEEMKAEDTANSSQIDLMIDALKN